MSYTSPVFISGFSRERIVYSFMSRDKLRAKSKKIHLAQSNVHIPWYTRKRPGRIFLHWAGPGHTFFWPGPGHYMGPGEKFLAGPGHEKNCRDPDRAGTGGPVASWHIPNWLFFEWFKQRWGGSQTRFALQCSNSDPTSACGCSPILIGIR